MTQQVQKLVTRLQSEGEKTAAFFREIPKDAWEITLYADGEQWNIFQILIHIVQAENSVQRLITSIVDGHEGAPKDFDLDGYNHRKVRELASQSAPELIALFLERRSETVQTVAAWSDEDLTQRGRHPFLGNAEVSEMVKLMYRHTQLHQRDIRKRLKKG
jgi:hypothetical protein